MGAVEYPVVFRARHRFLAPTMIACPSIADEPRGRDVLFTGLCLTCGMVTTRVDADKLPRHLPFRQPARVELVEAQA